MSKTEQEQQLYAAICDPTRRHIISMLAVQPRAVHDLADHFSISRPAVSKHLKVLKDVDLVTEQKHGRNRIYTTNPEPLKEVQSWIDTFWKGRLHALKNLVEHHNDGQG